jgi:hypothetical protein
VKTSSALAYVGHNSKGDRKKDDFYPTPPEATMALMDREIFNGNIWECACGNGAMSKVMIDKGYEVYSSDLTDRGYGEVGIDFLKADKKVDNIITNPPFNLSTEFTIKALKQANNQVAMLNKLSFLEGLKRKELIFSQKKLKKIWIFSRRVRFGGNGLMAFAWFIFDKNYNGLPEVDWI